MMLMTIICILAVDFKVFPRELAKCETWGVSVVRVHTFLSSTLPASRCYRLIKMIDIDGPRRRFIRILSRSRIGSTFSERYQLLNPTIVGCEWESLEEHEESPSYPPSGIREVTTSKRDRIPGMSG
jgi:hypothetical protein